MAYTDKVLNTNRFDDEDQAGDVVSLQSMQAPSKSTERYSSLRQARSNASLRASRRWRGSTAVREGALAEDEVDLLAKEEGRRRDEEDDGGLAPPEPADSDTTIQIHENGSNRFEETKGASGFLASLRPGHKRSTRPRTVPFRLDGPTKTKFPPNIVQNQKYNIASFVPLVLYEQFKFFFNMYFLLVALSQIIPALRIGYLATYIVPLAAVLLVTMGKEAYDDWQRFLRDRTANSTLYKIVAPLARRPPENISHHTSNDLAAGESESSTTEILNLRSVPSSKLKVGDVVSIEKDQRIPADVILLRTSDASGTCFIRTDQLDGETDWKLRVALEPTQTLGSDAQLYDLQGEIYADPPTKDIHTFVGTFENTSLGQSYPINAENVLWANTVLAAGSVICYVIYTGPETRAVMNTNQPKTKIGLLDLEINKIAKILCTVTFILSVIMVAFNGFRGPWYIYVFRFLILFSTIIPISLRVNLDMGKTVYAHQIQHDKEIAGTVVRTSTLPEELGRVEYLLSDKTGTLTQNEMEMKKLHMGTMSYGHDSMDEVAHQLSLAFELASPAISSSGMAVNRGRRDLSSRVRDAVIALALCHNVTPVMDETDTGSNEVTYQASSPDEVAIVKWTQSIGLTLVYRDRTSIHVRSSANGITFKYDILEIFPFTSETKRMGIVVRDSVSRDITFYQKGADVVMTRIVNANDWLEEECGNMAREGLRTLVVGRKRLTEEDWLHFQREFAAAKVSLNNRNEAISLVVRRHLEDSLDLLAVTGVEDKLQTDVRLTLELLRNAGIKIWMLTGDKIETATCIAISSKLVSRGQYIHQVAKVQDPSEIREELEFLRTKQDSCLVIDGESLHTCLQYCREEFMVIATQLPCVVACRCSPTQKADVARLIRSYTKKRVCCIGDGGNDVSMIQAADVGIGIVGKEGKQASLAADFSILQFSYLSKLLCWHGRNSYKRSAKLAQFVVHRGLLVAVVQAVFSAIVFFSPVAIFQDWLSVGYATVYTMGPVFSLVLDTDINENLALVYPELYAELTKGRSLSLKTFFIWVLISVYQGGAIMVASVLLFESEFINIVAIAFTATILNELVMVAVEVTTWHPLMIAAELGSLFLYGASMAFLPQYFDLSFVLSVKFVSKVGIIVAISAFPLVVIKYLKQRLSPATYAKVLAF